MFGGRGPASRRAIPGGGAGNLDDFARTRYRALVRRDNPLSRWVEQHQVIEDLLDRAAELEAHTTRVVRSLDPDGYQAFLEVLTIMRATQFAAVSDSGDNDYQTWYARMRQDAADGKLPVSQWAAVDRVASLLSLSDRSPVLRQLDPACPVAVPRPRPGPGPGVLAAAEPLRTRFSALEPQVGAAGAAGSVDDELSAVLAGYRDLRDRQPDGSEDWRFLQWWCATVTSTLARSAARQREAGSREAGSAVRAFRNAAAEWDRIGESAQVDDCLVAAAEIALAEGADVDQALAPLVQQAERSGSDAGQLAAPRFSRARLLARLGQVYLGAGDRAAARARADAAASTLQELGFADPAVSGTEAAFTAWLEADPGKEIAAGASNRTMAVLAEVIKTWANVIAVRMRAGAADSGPPDAAVAYSPAELLGQLANLIQELSGDARQVDAQLEQEAAAFGLLPPATAPARPGLLDLTIELSRLQDEFELSGDAGHLEGLLSRVEALESRVLAAGPSGLGPIPTVASVLRSDVLSQLGRPGEAAEVLAAARDRLASDRGLDEADRRSLLVTVIGREAMAQAWRGDFAGMSERCGEGIREAERDRGRIDAPYLQESYLRDRGRLYDWGVFAAQKTGDHELMLARADLAKARGVLGWAVLDQGDPGLAGGPADEAAFRELTAALERGDPAAPAGGDRPQLTVKRRVLWDRLMATGWRSGRESPAPAFSLAALQARLAPDEAVVSYYWLSRSTLAIAVLDRGSLVSEKVNLEDAQRAALADLASAIAGPGRPAPWTERDLSDAGPMILPRQGGDLLAGKRRLIISPHGLLHRLPFHALGYGGGLLTEHFAVSYVPSLTSLLLPDPARRPRRVLAVGGSEAAAVAELYRHAGVPATELVSAQATVARINDLRDQGTLAEHTVLHLATPGDDRPPELPPDSALRLLTGKIDDLEISQWRLHAELVVLSACRPAHQRPSGDGNEDSPDDEVLGLQAAFFAAGSRQVLGALWPADQTSARALMLSLHQAMNAGQAADLALRQAMLDLRATGASMYRWAPYKLVRLGGGPSPQSGR
jgi:hypothetical protein